MGQDISVQSPFVAKKNFLRADGTPFWEFLEKSGIEYNKDHFPFLSNHETPRIKPVFDFDEYIQLGSRGEALGYLYSGLGKALNYVGPVLDMELTHGFNDHTDRHTLWVSQTGVELLQRSGFSHHTKEDSYGPITEIMMTLVGMTHDLGNFMDRKDHSTYSAWLLSRLFSNQEKHLSRWQFAQYAILFHEEPVLKESGVRLQDGSPLQWALVAADKMHVGRDRIGGRSFESGLRKRALEEDAHILLNALVVRSTWFLTLNTFVWHLDFSIDQLEEKFEAFTRGSQNRIWVPKQFQRMLVSKGVKYRETFAAMFREIYIHRMKMAAESVFLLFPFIDTFEVRLSDVDSRGKVGSADLVVWETSREY